MTVLSAVAMMFWMSIEVTLVALGLLTFTNVALIYPLQQAAKKSRLVKFKASCSFGLGNYQRVTITSIYLKLFLLEKRKSIS